MTWWLWVLVGACVYPVLAFTLAVAVSARLKRMSLAPPSATRAFQWGWLHGTLPLPQRDAPDGNASDANFRAVSDHETKKEAQARYDELVARDAAYEDVLTIVKSGSHDPPNEPA